jgi:hypothetical protein
MVAFQLEPSAMKKIVIATLVGAVIVFAFQALSWIVTPIHADALRYSDKDMEIRAFLSERLTDHAVYSFPGKPPGMSEEEHQAMMMEHANEPWMTVTYHPSMNMDMSGSMLTGFLYGILSVLIIVWILTAASDVFSSFGSRFFVCVLFGVFLVLNSSLADLNWWSTPWHFVSGELIDGLLTWTLCGLWLGFYLKPSHK